MTVYIGLDGHLYIRVFGHLLYRSPDRLPPEVIEAGIKLKVV